MSSFRKNPIAAFYEKLEECTRKSDFYSPPKDFVLAERLLEWLRGRPDLEHGSDTASRATIILETVYKGDEPYAGAWSYFDERMDKDQSQCWLKLLVILLQMDEHGGFAEFLHRFSIAGIWDSRLSDIHRRSSELYTIIQSTNFYDEDECHQAVDWFIHLATQLSTRKSMTLDHKRRLEPHMLLPITKKDDIDSGGQSNVFRIEVPEECLPPDFIEYLTRLHHQPILDEKHSDGKSYYYEFALKKIAREEDWIREVDFHQALRASQTEGIVQCLGSWEVQTRTGTDYYLLLEFGYSDLNQYFRSIPPPSIAQHIYDFWRSLSSVSAALSHIHSLDISSKHSATVRYYVWHGDIKPANILICDDGIKLTDPGWAQIVRRTDAQTDEKGFPIVVLNGGTSSYGAPERIDQKEGKIDGSRPVTQRFDIWSLGCVFLEAATWVILGARGVDQFRTARKMAHQRNGSGSDLGGDDCFHYFGRESYILGLWIGFLRRGIRAEDVVTVHILDIIQNEMLVIDPHKRIASEDLVRRIDGTLRSSAQTISTKLPPYVFPKHLEPAFDLEQKLAAEAWERLPSCAPSAKASEKPMLGRSVRFTPPRGPLIDNDPVYGQTPANPRASGSTVHLRPDVRTDQAVPYYAAQAAGYNPNATRSNTQSQFAPQGRHYAQPSNYPYAQQTQWSTAPPPPPEAQSQSPVTSPYGDSTGSLSAPPPKDEIEEWGYYKALDLLISTRGWEYGSLLQLPGSSLKPPAPAESRPVPGRPDFQAKEAQRANTWSLMRTSSVKKSEKPSAYRSGLAQAFHKIMPSVKTTRLNNPTPRGTPAPALRPSAAPVQPPQSDATFGDLFDERDIIILVDNSSSMAPHWPQVHDVLQLLMAMLWGQDDDGIDLFFTSSTVPCEKLMEPWQVIEPLKQKCPKPHGPGTTHQPTRNSAGDLAAEKDPDDIYKVLSHILNIIGPGETYAKKVTLLVLTDGVWPKSDSETVTTLISHWLTRMLTVEGGNPDAVRNERYYSIQFVQFGDDPVGTKRLEHLDDDLVTKSNDNVPDIIDVEPASGHVLKMIMGSLDKTWDEKPRSSGENVSSPGLGGESSTSSYPKPSTSPPAAPLPHQYLSQRTGTGQSTWNTTTSSARGMAFSAPPIIEEPEMDHYTSRPPVQQQRHPHRTSPPVPLTGGNYGGTNWAGLGLPLQQRQQQNQQQHPYGFTPQPPQGGGAQQPQRRMTAQGLTHGHGTGTPPLPGEEARGSPSRPQRRRDTGSHLGYH